ncbi:MAG: hypothetical protein PHP26_03005 [Syntrophomonas sp.]|uniref:hypothetical protein n=1 Tax=Syntrophomonas sp. TaxID=2053627 RepID=UPI00260C8838|nr:hypothetical protein [Syntrophomonas sp.]MDD2511218.1 hypothetical protein [Syntrophomonas sp.]MDD3878944.1 hypothetical protein [Syntrophomonas sp.]MDD4626627.1 hypothetical protein [Syntrophomonas sp.]
MTINSGIRGMKYFGVKVTPLITHSGLEDLIFIHLRDGFELSHNATRADFDVLDGAQAGFNIEPGDIIKVFIVDRLTNDLDVNPVLLL